MNKTAQPLARQVQAAEADRRRTLVRPDEDSIVPVEGRPSAAETSPIIQRYLLLINYFGIDMPYLRLYVSTRTVSKVIRMSELAGEQSHRFIELTGEIVAAYVSRNHVAGADLPALIASVHAAISHQVSGQPAPKEEAAERPSAAQIRKSVTSDALVSFIDGTPYKTLKRHLTKHGFTPETYRERFGLPVDYPMVAASYSETRSHLARSLGLGQNGGRAAKADQVPPSPKGRRKAA